MSLPDFSDPDDGRAEVPPTEDDQPGTTDQAEPEDSGPDQLPEHDWQAGLEQAELEREVQSRRLELAAVERNFDSRLREQIARCDATIEAVRELRGRARSGSLARIREDIGNLDGLLAEHDREASRAGAQLLGNDAADWIGHYRAAVEEKAGDLRLLEDQLRREQHIEEGHISRVPGLAERALTGISRTIVTQVARMAAAVLARHIAAGNGDHLARGCEMIMRAFDAPEKLDRAEALKAEVPLSIGTSLIGLNIGTMLTDADVAAGQPPPAGPDASPSHQPANWPSVEIVEEGIASRPADETPEPAEPETAKDAEESSEPEDVSEPDVDVAPGQPGVHRGVQREPAGSAAGGRHAAAPAGAGQLSGPAPSEDGPPRELADEDPAQPARLTHWRWWAPDTPSQETGPEIWAPAAGGREPAGEAPATDSPPQGSPPAAGVVIWGSAKVIAGAARMRILSSDVLLSFARREAFRKIYDGTPGSVLAAMDAACGIEVVVLLDPDIQGGLWVDVDPVTQAPAATMLIEMPISADGDVEDLRLFRYEA